MNFHSNLLRIFAFHVGYKYTTKLKTDERRMGLGFDCYTLNTIPEIIQPIWLIEENASNSYMTAAAVFLFLNPSRRFFFEILLSMKLVKNNTVTRI